MKIAIVGAGGVGGYFGGMLAVHGHDVWFVARGRHLSAMRRHGLRILTSGGGFTVQPGQMTDTAGDIGPADVVLFCVKSYDTESAARLLTPILIEKTIIISLQNGVDNEEKIRRIVPTGTVYGGVAYIYSTITAPGEITESGGPRKIVFGPLHPPEDAEKSRCQDIVAAFIDAGIDAEWTMDVLSALWKKFIFIAPVAGLTALTRLTLGEILAVETTRNLLSDAMHEVCALAIRLQIDIAPDYVPETFEKLQQFSNKTRSSLYYDLVHGKPMELDALAGTVVRLGRELNVPTPIHRTIYAALLPHATLHASQQQAGEN